MQSALRNTTATFTLLGTLLGMLSALQGCASILGESRYPVAVSSAPAGAAFEVTDKHGERVHSGNTPSTVTLKSASGFFSGQTYTVRFKKPGYPDRTVTLDSSISGWYWGNILFGGVIGLLIIDPATGAMFKLPETLSADMGTPLAESGQRALTLVTVDSLTPEQREGLIPLT